MTLHFTVNHPHQNPRARFNSTRSVGPTHQRPAPSSQKLQGPRLVLLLPREAASLQSIPFRSEGSSAVTGHIPTSPRPQYNSNLSLSAREDPGKPWRSCRWRPGCWTCDPASSHQSPRPRRLCHSPRAAARTPPPPPRPRAALFPNSIRPPVSC